MTTVIVTTTQALHLAQYAMWVKRVVQFQTRKYRTELNRAFQQLEAGVFPRAWVN